MRILLVSDTFPPDVNGAARFTERLGAGMVRRGHEVHQIAPATGPRDANELHEGVVIHRLRSVRYPLVESFRFVYPWDAYPKVATVVRSIRPDVIHVQNHFILGRAAASAARRQNVPLVATNHFMPENLTDHARVPRAMQQAAARIAWADLRRVFGSAKVLTAPTPRAVELLERSARLAGALAISCGIDTGLYEKAAAAAQPNAVPVILFVGRLDQEKRVNELISAVAALPEDLPYHVEIIGDGAHRENWKKLADSLGLGPDRVAFRGFVDEDELVEAYGRCDIFCIPGVAELQSLVTLEAMSAGKPIVAANAMALPHLVHPGSNGWLYEPGDVAELTSRIEHLLRHPEERRRMGAESKKIVAPHALGGTLDRFEEIYHQVAAV